MGTVTLRAAETSTFKVALRQTIAGTLLSLLSVALAAFAFPPVGFWPLIFVAWIPMLVAQHRVLPPRLAGLAMGIGLGGCALLFLWGVPEPPIAWHERFLPVVVAIGLGTGLVPVGWLDRRFHERTGYRWLLISTPLAWTGVEFVRALLPLVGTWGWPSNALYEQPWLIQPVSVLGTPALIALILAINYAGAAVVLGRAGRGLSLVVLACTCWIAASLLLLDSPRPTLRVAAVQPGPDPAGVASPATLTAQTRRAAMAGARLIVWSEDVLPYDPRGADGAWVRRLARATAAYIVAGHSRPGGDLSKATLISPDGHALNTYTKEHPVAFAGEQTDHDGRFPVSATAIGRIGTIICFDGAYTDSARAAARNGAQVIALPAWDWPGIAHNSNALNVFRAVENRVAIVRAELAYDSAIVDPYGRILARKVTSDGAAATLVADVPLGRGHSPWVSIGPWFGWLCAGWLALYSMLCLSATIRTGAEQPLPD